MSKEKPYRHCSGCWAGLSVLWTRSPLSSLFVARKVRNASWSSSSYSCRWTRSPVEDARTVWVNVLFSNMRRWHLFRCALTWKLSWYYWACVFDLLKESETECLQLFREICLCFWHRWLLLHCQSAKFGICYTQKFQYNKSVIKSQRSQYKLKCFLLNSSCYLHSI